ncbi:hypothetical protein MMPV_004756 [Pyropia vietnamensis]
MTVAQPASPTGRVDTTTRAVAAPPVAGAVATHATAPPGMTVVMVYGTLKRGFPNAPLLTTSIYLGRCTTVGAYPLVVGGDWYSPYLLASPGKGHRVVGELYAVTPDALAALDVLENVGVNYSRELIDVVGPRGEVRAVHTYLKVNYTRELACGECLVDYQDRRYVPRTERARYAIPPGCMDASRSSSVAVGSKA